MEEKLRQLVSHFVECMEVDSPRPSNCQKDWWEGYCTGMAMGFALASKKLQRVIDGPPAPYMFPSESFYKSKPFLNQFFQELKKQENENDGLKFIYRNLFLYIEFGEWDILSWICYLTESCFLEGAKKFPLSYVLGICTVCKKFDGVIGYYPEFAQACYESVVKERGEVEAKSTFQGLL